jgi:hypothetical protein
MLRQRQKKNTAMKNQTPTKTALKTKRPKPRTTATLLQRTQKDLAQTEPTTKMMDLKHLVMDLKLIQLIPILKELMLDPKELMRDLRDTRRPLRMKVTAARLKNQR